MKSVAADNDFNKDRQIEGMERRMGPSNINSELAILLLLVVSGLTGLVTSSVMVTATMFGGGFATWVFFTLPDYLRAQTDQQQQAKEADAVAAKAAVPLPSSSGGPAAEGPPALPTPAAVMSLIKRRRSVFPKDYNGQKVPREQLELLLEAANWAPTHGQTEPWRFVVLEGESKVQMEELTMELCRTRLSEEKAAKTTEKLQKKRDSTWGKISCYIAICCKRQAKPEKLMPEWEEMAAVSCATQNMALMSTSLGLAAYWTSWQEVAREAPEMKELLGLAVEDRVMGFFTVGCINRDRLEGYRASRGPWADKVTWRS